MCEKLWSIFKYVYKTVKYCSRLYSTQNQVLSFYLKKKGVLINFFLFLGLDHFGKILKYVNHHAGF